MQDTEPVSWRIIHLKCDINFRDFGGYPISSGAYVKQGRLYRSGTLSRLADEDIHIVKALGLKRVIDLRTPREIELEGYDRTYEENESGYDFLGFNYGDPYLTNARVSNELEWNMRQVDFPSIYINMLEHNKPAIRLIFDRLADPDQYPLLIHCTQGKDRTGIIVALLLLMLEVPVATVTEDYLLTDQLVDIDGRLAEMERYLSEYAGSVPEGITANDWLPFFKCLPDSLDLLFSHLETAYSGVTGFLQSIGITTDKQSVIQNTLLVKS